MTSPVCRIGACTAYGLSDTGRHRTENEDRFVIDAAVGLIAVADGMGGHECGALASATALQRVSARLSMAHEAANDAADSTIAMASGGGSLATRSSLDSLLDLFPRPNPATASDTAPDADPDATLPDIRSEAIRTVIEAIDDANTTLFSLNADEHCVDGRGMGTTLTGLWLPQGADVMIAFHVGDSRLYRLRDGELRQLSRDQTLYQQALDLGALDALPPRNILLQALGPMPEVSPSVSLHAWLPGDRYLLCSDGLYGEVPHHEIQAVLAGSSEATLEGDTRRLIDLALDAGGKDNVTAVIICFGA